MYISLFSFAKAPLKPLLFVLLPLIPSLLPGQSENRIIIEWNELAYQIAYEHDQFYSFIGIRSLTMTHLAIHDALNAIDQQFESYTYHDSKPKASTTAAIAQAACEVLQQAYPSRKSTTDSLRLKWLKNVPEGKAKQLGIELGKAAAQAIIERRKGDGHQKQGDYTPMTKPGDYQYTPGWNGWVLKPDFNYARPFGLDSVTQFRAPTPPPLNSATYTQSFREVKAYGAKNSQVRSTDQTHYAHWWAEFGEHSWNRIGRIVAKQNAPSLHETARMFALINMNIYDIYLASLESKYYYDTWRPYTAIRQAYDDNNPQTEADSSWQPEMLTPPWPEYPSAHAAEQVCHSD